MPHLHPPLHATHSVLLRSSLPGVYPRMEVEARGERGREGASRCELFAFNSSMSSEFWLAGLHSRHGAVILCDGVAVLSYLFLLMYRIYFCIVVKHKVKKSIWTVWFGALYGCYLIVFLKIVLFLSFFVSIIMFVSYFVLFVSCLMFELLASAGSGLWMYEKNKYLMYNMIKTDVSARL